MTSADFRRIALSLEGVEEVAHAGLPAFRVGGTRFASLASQSEGYGNLTLTLEQQAAFVEEAPEIFLPIPGGWGKMGHSPRRGERGCPHWRATHRVETADGEECEDARDAESLGGARRSSKQEGPQAVTAIDNPSNAPLH